MSANLKHVNVCGNPYCGISTGVHDGLTFGSGDLDDNGFWEAPCALCARAWERAHPEDDPCWPFAACKHPEHRLGTRGGLRPHQRVCMTCGEIVMRKS